MALGWIPYYLDRIDNEKNLSENIDDFFFRDKLRIATISRNCWRGTAPNGESAQIDLVLEWKANGLIISVK